MHNPEKSDPKLKNPLARSTGNSSTLLRAFLMFLDDSFEVDFPMKLVKLLGMMRIFFRPREVTQEKQVPIGMTLFLS
jgi:hypothetical protein